MKIVIPAETQAGEKRVAMMPSVVVADYDSTLPELQALTQQLGALRQRLVPRRSD